MWICAVVLIIILAFYLRHTARHHVYNAADDRSYAVVSDFADHDVASRLLGETNRQVIRFLRHLRTKYRVGYHIVENGQIYDREDDDVSRIIENIITNYNPEKIFETNPKWTSDTSYTINKGEQMYICLRNKTPPYNFVDKNTLMFVVLHEISHIGAYDVFGHPNRFWEVFRFILKEARDYGIYRETDYEKRPIMYCGLNINYSPLFDRSLREIN